MNVDGDEVLLVTSAGYGKEDRDRRSFVVRPEAESGSRPSS